MFGFFVGQAMKASKGKANPALVKVNVEQPSEAEPRPGATTTAKIHCGRRSIGYVWLHDIWDAAIEWLRF